MPAGRPHPPPSLTMFTPAFVAPTPLGRSAVLSGRPAATDVAAAAAATTAAAWHHVSAPSPQPHRPAVGGLSTVAAAAAAAGLALPAVLLPSAPAAARTVAESAAATAAAVAAAANGPDAPAVDMLSFAASGPGWVALAAVVSVAAIFGFSYLDVGPAFRPARPLFPADLVGLGGTDGRGGGNAAPPTGTLFLLRLVVGAPLTVELSTGAVKQLTPGEHVLRFDRHDACLAAARGAVRAARAVSPPGATPADDVDTLSYIVYRASPSGGLAELSRHPRPTYADASASWRDLVSPGGVASGAAPPRPRRNITDVESLDLEGVWAAYEQLGAAGPLETEWSSLMRKAASFGGQTLVSADADDAAAGGSPASAGATDSCRLCGGGGTKACHRCGGASARGGTCTLCNASGRLACSRCGGSGRQITF
ncbi:hypothetical protein MMPV_007663 [Pyropia vietnamensis]